MNKQIIWLIIGVMSVAITGVVALQTKLVLKSIRANEEAFDKNVQNALSTVAKRIEEAAAEQDRLLVLNGYAVEYLQLPGLAADKLDPLNGAMSVPILEDPIPVRTGNPLADELINKPPIDPKDLCADCRRRYANHLHAIQQNFKYINTYSPIEERIDVRLLGEILKQELENNAIRTEFSYGVYSEERGTYVIKDGQVLADHILGNTSPQARFANLDNSPYRVPLFDDETEAQQQSSGRLHLFFPDHSQVVWSTLLPSFLGTFLFAAIILACFGYTIWVIFDQKRLSEMKTDFINNMTHEFKTPIATISLAADSITNPRISSDPAKVARFANIIKQENKRMNNQVERVLQMAQIDRRESKLRLTDVDLHEVIHRAVENISLQVEPRQGSVKTELSAQQPVIEGDLTHVSNIINNLLDNANKYSPEAPQISVRTRDVEGGVEVTISDRGLGLSKEARKRIFDKFYRVHTGDLHDVKGFGLGLSYVRAMIAKHHGRIDVQSELGKGSDFILYFPTKQPTGAVMTD
ncbi:MAG: sensor histidine kinase [Bacteroidetes bacterium]|nr:MAG: sensor histidine kinase [Bacteroidota bacterium]